MNWLRHAFAIKPEAQFVPTDEQQAMVRRFCDAVVARRLTTATMVAIESFRPLHNIGAQALVMLAPMLSLAVPARQIEDFVRMLERPGCVEYVCSQLTQTEAERHSTTAAESEQTTSVPG